MEAVASGVWTTAPHVLGYNPNTCHGYMHGAAAGVDAELNGLPTSHRRGQAAFDELCARLPWLDARFSPEGMNKPALHPIVESERMYVVRSKDIHDILATAWRQDQAAPAPGAPPLRTQQGNLFLEHTNYAASDGNLQSCSPLYELKYELNVSPTFRPARSCSRDQFDHTCLETARFVVMLNDLSRLGKAALPYFRDFKLEDTPAGQNPLVAVLKILYDNDNYRPKAPLRNTLTQTFLELKYDVVFYISTYLEAFERLITHSHRLPVVHACILSLRNATPVYSQG